MQQRYTRGPDQLELAASARSARAAAGAGCGRPASRRRRRRLVDMFSEGTRPTSIRREPPGITAGQLLDRPGQLQSDRPPRQCCPRQALRATPRSLAPRAESWPHSGDVGVARPNRTGDLLITRRKVISTSAVFRRDSLQGTYLRCPYFSSVSGSSLHEWLHAAATTPPSAGPLRPTIRGGQRRCRVREALARTTPDKAKPQVIHLVTWGLVCAIGGVARSEGFEPPTF